MPFRQKTCRSPVQMGDLLDAILCQRVVIGCGQRPGIFDVQLFLTRLCLAFGALHRNAHGAQMVADRAHYALFFGGLEDVVVFIVVRDRLEVEPSPRNLVMGALKQEKLQLRRHHR
ncbi:hypothetical protein TRM7557_01959 [Tritonibacter multivorans]|uniref:Uncharacterized protein n=1 Tax=Tritonibacter multivorans TaxID=928856 RepID=A0A0N7LZU1_9RHOB|nr:hypothetical protein TRM7557_01959 [Tritonibacter multivorans]